MGKHQLGLELSNKEIASIESFLASLTDSSPDSVTDAPLMPDDPATDKTV